MLGSAGCDSNLPLTVVISCVSKMIFLKIGGVRLKKVTGSWLGCGVVWCMAGGCGVVFDFIVEQKNKEKKYYLNRISTQ